MKLRLLPNHKEYTITHFAETYNTRDGALSIDIQMETEEGLPQLREAFTASQSFELLRNEATYSYTAYELGTITRTYTKSGEERTSVRFVETVISTVEQ